MDPVSLFIQGAWGSDPGRFPGPQPVSIERRHFPWLRRQPYLVCEKTDGVRHLLACLPGSKECHLVDRCFAVRETLAFGGFPKDTLLDGELVTTKEGKRLFMIHDAVRVKGEDLREAPLTKRLAAAALAVKLVIKSKKDTLELRVKQMIPLERIRELKPLDSFEYETDGLVFTPEREPIRMGTHETMFKWKPRERITIDFVIYSGARLFVQDKGVPYEEAELHLRNARPDIPDGTIVECGYNDLGFFVEKIRTDKTHANNRRTFSRTMVNIREAINYDELLCV